MLVMLGKVNFIYNHKYAPEKNLMFFIYNVLNSKINCIVQREIYLNKSLNFKMSV